MHSISKIIRGRFAIGENERNSLVSVRLVLQCNNNNAFCNKQTNVSVCYVESNPYHDFNMFIASSIYPLTHAYIESSFILQTRTKQNELAPSQNNIIIINNV